MALTQMELEATAKEIMQASVTYSSSDNAPPQKKIEIKKDCFAYGDEIKPSCKALTGLYCMTEHCKFYKTQAQLDAERRKTKKRLKQICKAL